MKVYPRAGDKHQKFDGFTSEELREAMAMYTDKVRSEVINSLEDTYEIRLDLIDDGETLSFFHYAIDMAMTKGMELGENISLVRYHYEDQKRVKVDRINHYNFELNKGISGVLFPNGEFKECGNAQHYILTENLSFEEKTKCIYLSSTLFGNDDGDIKHSPVGFEGLTLEQINWLNTNYIYFDGGQKEAVWSDWIMLED